MLLMKSRLLPTVLLPKNKQHVLYENNSELINKLQILKTKQSICIGHVPKICNNSFGNKTFKSAIHFYRHKALKLKYLAKYYSSTVLICVCYPSSPEKDVTKEHRNKVPSLFAYPSIQDKHTSSLPQLASYQEASKTILEKTGKHT